MSTSIRAQIQAGLDARTRLVPPAAEQRQTPDEPREEPGAVEGRCSDPQWKDAS